MIMLHYIDITNVRYVYVILLAAFGTLRLKMLKNSFSNTRTVHILRKMYQKMYT